MGIKEKFSAEDWEFLCTTPLLVGSSMSMAGSSGIMGTMKEALASTQAFLSGAEDFPDNELVSAMGLKPTNMEEARSTAKAQREKVMGRMKECEIKSSEDMRAMVLDDCRKASYIIGEAGEDALGVGFKEWLLSIADKVANAASEGGFLGFGGTRYSEEEQKFTAQLREALGMDPVV